jgi:hypothetical protein
MRELDVKVESDGHLSLASCAYMYYVTVRLLRRYLRRHETTTRLHANHYVI